MDGRLPTRRGRGGRWRGRFSSTEAHRLTQATVRREGVDVTERGTAWGCERFEVGAEPVRDVVRQPGRQSRRTRHRAAGTPSRVAACARLPSASSRSYSDLASCDLGGHRRPACPAVSGSPRPDRLGPARPGRPRPSRPGSSPRSSATPSRASMDHAPSAPRSPPPRAQRFADLLPTLGEGGRERRVAAYGARPLAVLVGKLLPWSAHRSPRRCRRRRRGPGAVGPRRVAMSLGRSRPGPPASQRRIR